jgi:hypothetical protein
LWAALGAERKEVSTPSPLNPQGEAMRRQPVRPCKRDRTDEPLTAPGGLALLAEGTHGLGLRALVDRLRPQPRSHRGDAPEGIVETLSLLLQAGGQTPWGPRVPPPRRRWSPPSRRPRSSRGGASVRKRRGRRLPQAVATHSRRRSTPGSRPRRPSVWSVRAQSGDSARFQATPCHAPRTWRAMLVTGS